MNSQSNSRNQRSKVFKVNQTLHLVVLLVICIWLLYQIKSSNYDNKEKVALGLGRKVDTGRSKTKTDPKAKNSLNNYAISNDEIESHGEYKELQKVDNITEIVQHEETAIGTTTISFSDENGIPQDVKEEEERGIFYNGKGDTSELGIDGVEENSRDVHQRLEEVIERSTSQQDE